MGTVKLTAFSVQDTLQAGVHIHLNSTTSAIIFNPTSLGAKGAQGDEATRQPLRVVHIKSKHITGISHLAERKDVGKDWVVSICATSGDATGCAATIRRGAQELDVPIAQRSLADKIVASLGKQTTVTLLGAVVRFLAENVSDAALLWAALSWGGVDVAWVGPCTTRKFEIKQRDVSDGACDCPPSFDDATQNYLRRTIGSSHSRLPPLLNFGWLNAARATVQRADAKKRLEQAFVCLRALHTRRPTGERSATDLAFVGVWSWLADTEDGDVHLVEDQVLTNAIDDAYHTQMGERVHVAARDKETIAMVLEDRLTANVGSVKLCACLLTLIAQVRCDTDAAHAIIHQFDMCPTSVCFEAGTLDAAILCGGLLTRQSQADYDEILSHKSRFEELLRGHESRLRIAIAAWRVTEWLSALPSPFDVTARAALSLTFRQSCESPLELASTSTSHSLSSTATLTGSVVADETPTMLRISPARIDAGVAQHLTMGCAVWCPNAAKYFRPAVTASDAERATINREIRLLASQLSQRCETPHCTPLTTSDATMLLESAVTLEFFSGVASMEEVRAAETYVELMRLHGWHVVEAPTV